MKTYTQEEILAEKAKVQNIWLKSAFCTSTIIFAVLLYSTSKIADIGVVYNLLFLFSVLWLLPQLIGILTHRYFNNFFKYYDKLHTVISLIAQFPILIVVGNILKTVGILNVLTVLVAWLYLLIELLLYANMITKLREKNKN